MSTEKVQHEYGRTKFRSWRGWRLSESARECILEVRQQGGYTILSMRSWTTLWTRLWQASVTRSACRSTKTILLL